jgi:ATP-dependent helicase Lhr and Lhr-like helicase
MAKKSVTKSPPSPVAQSSKEARLVVEQWFQSRGWKPFTFQRQAWQAHGDSNNLLIHSATGTGKTLAAWMGPILQWLKHPIPSKEWNQVRGQQPVAPLLVLWITPLRALAADTQHSLQSVLEQMKLPWRLESRTGDTPSSQKQRQRSTLPTALVTTPESLSLLLSYPEAEANFKHLRAVIVDEWHELLSTKRGVLVELALARLRAICPAYRVCGLSATLGNLDEAMRVLVGPANQQAQQVIEGIKDRKLELQAIFPPDIERFPWAGHLGTRQAKGVVEAVQKSQSTLIFTNTRNQTETWYQELLKQAPTLAGQIALHHGSLDATVRSWVERALANEQLKAVVCTSSLDLGVDFSAVDQVVQIGSPKGVARLLQRAGRSGHAPGQASRLQFVPTNALELIEFAAVRKRITERKLESRQPIDAPLDLLAQHLVTRGCASPYTRASILAELNSTHAYADLTKDELEWVIKFAKNGGECLTRYEDFQRLEEDDQGQLFVANKKVQRTHRMAIGTIVSDVAVQVRYMTGKNLGTVEESFIARIKPGDRFLLGGKLLSLVMVRDSIAWVKAAKGTPTSVPRWNGGRMPLSSQLSQAIREAIEFASQGIFDSVEMKAVRPILELQQRWSHLPNTQQLLIEQIRTREGFQLFVFPFEGRLVHEGLSAIVAYRLSRHRGISFSIAANDYGFVLQSPTDPNLQSSDARKWFSSDNLLNDVLASLNATEMTRRQFREIARIAGLIRTGYPGEKRAGRHLQASSDLIFEVFREFDPENLLLSQARREVLEQQLEWDRLNATLDRIEKSEVIWRQPTRPTPFAFPLLVDRLRERMSTESLADRVRRMQQSLEKAADLSNHPPA